MSTVLQPLPLPSEDRRVLRLPPAVWLVLMLLAAGAMYVCTLTTRSYWLDESLAARDVHMGFINMLLTRAKAGHTPLYFSFMWVWVRVLGDSDFLLRLPSVIFALASAAALYRLTARLAGPRVALGAVLLMLTAPPMIVFAQWMRMYCLIQLLALLAADTVLRWEKNPNRCDFWCLAIFTALLLATHYSALLVVFSLAVYLLARPVPAWRLAVALAIGLLLFCPWLLTYLIAARTASKDVEWLGVAQGSIAFMPAKLLVGQPAPWQAAAGASIAIVLVAGFGAWTLGKRGLLLTVVWAFPLSLATAMVAVGYPNILKEPRYFIASMAAQAALLAAALLARPGVARVVGSVVVLAVVVFNLTTFAAAEKEPDKTPWNRIGAAIEHERGADESVLLLTRWSAPFDRYYHGEYFMLVEKNPPKLDYQPKNCRVVNDAQLAEATASTAGVWIVVDPGTQQLLGNDKPDPANIRAAVAALRARFPVETHVVAARCDLYHLRAE